MRLAPRGGNGRDKSGPPDDCLRCLGGELLDSLCSAGQLLSLEGPLDIAPL